MIPPIASSTANAHPAAHPSEPPNMVAKADVACVSRGGPRRLRDRRGGSSSSSSSSSKSNGRDTGRYSEAWITLAPFPKTVTDLKGGSSDFNFEHQRRNPDHSGVGVVRSFQMEH